jgi:YjbE family integral membrane protein
MDLGSDLSWLGICLKIFFVDVLLGGDNALVIALACRGLPSALVPRAIALGAAGAIVFRGLIAATAGTLLAVPLLKAASGVLLILVAINLLVGDYMQGDGDDGLDVDASFVGRDNFVGAAFVILVVDAIMSLDNVVALAAVSQGNLAYLVGGLLFSIPFLFWGSLIVAEAMKHFPVLVMVGSGLLGWVAGELIVSDPLWADWVRANAEAATVCLPFAAAVFVVFEARITADARIAERAAVPVARVVAPRRPVAPPPRPVPVVTPMSIATPIPAAAPAPRVAASVAVAALAPASARPSQTVGRKGPPPRETAADRAGRRNDAIVLMGLLVMLMVVAAIFIVAVLLSNSVDP